MTLLGQAQTGMRSSTPKIVKISGDDNLKVVYRNLGNNHSYPFMWADTVTMSGTEVVVASGVKFHGYDLATYGNVTATPLGNPGGYLWVTKDTAENVVKVHCAASYEGDIDVKYMIGEASTSRYIEAIYCRGNSGASPSLP